MKDPGPEPPPTIVTTFSAADVGRTSENELGWLSSKRLAADVATGNATHAAGQRCVDGGGKLKEVFMVVEVLPCKARMEMTVEVWNCYHKAQVSCEKQTENPEHARWVAATRTAETDRRRGDQLDAAHAQCVQSRDEQILSCGDRCMGRNLCKRPEGATAPGREGRPPRPGAGKGGSTTKQDSDRPLVYRDPIPLTQQDQQRLAFQRMDRASADLAAALAKAGPPTKREMKVIAIVGGAIIAPFAVAKLADHDLGLSIIFQTVLFGGTTLVAGLTPLGNPHSRSLMEKNYQEAIDRGRARCEEGVLASCEEVVDLSKAMRGTLTSGRARPDSSLAFGPSGLSGPDIGIRSWLTLSFDSSQATEFSGGETGVGSNAAARSGPIYVGLGLENRTISVLEEGATEVEDFSVLTMAAFAGVQLGGGLLSPYAELRGRLHGTLASAGPGADSILTLGNNFDLTPLWSSRGPFVVAPFIDVGATLPLSGVYEPGYRIGLGINAARPHPMTLADTHLDRDDRPARPVFHLNKFVPYVFGAGGMGIQLGRMNGASAGMRGRGKGPSENFLMVFADIGVGRGGAHIAIAGIGRRWLFDQRRYELGFYTAPMSIGASGSETLFEEGELGQVTVELLPVRVYGRYNGLPKVDLEVGVNMPAFWFQHTPSETIGQSGDFDVYEGLPIFGYVGIGI